MANFENQDIVIAPLPTIKYDKLLAQDSTEITRLVDVCKSLGFFYLDFNLSAAHSLVNNSNDVLGVMNEYFHQPIEVKMKDVRGTVTHGYCPVGRYAGAKKGERDCYETLKISEAEMKDRSPHLPVTVHNNVELFGEFISGSHSALITVLQCLSKGMGLTGDDCFENKHRSGVPARTTMVLFRYPRQVEEGKGIGHNVHTDIGSLTLLYCQDWGLQLLSPETNEWGFVKPQPGHAIINVGDSLRFLSGHQLRSCVHRVIPLTGRQETDRYSIAYFMRTEDKSVFVDSKGRRLSALAWHDEKYNVFRQPHEDQERDAVLTGGMEKHGSLILV
ncbi:Hypothetical protein R9X50_00025000 [Acrodontium crateriforme]|uniref:Fe2OG dioxygenase domain-containing protein n=1 Tax=Acrodontium crateriforme TaxID=150365 RepID=A0AAQ3LX48_9PEZI|nr:Hypothetical protein R9X50_00025000 [Acrodontium crateriforme]